jgi:hypothetical protein
MPGNSFDRTIINPRERPLSSDINQLQSQVDRALRQFALQLMASVTSDSDESPLPANGFMGNSFRVAPDSPLSMNVLVKSGLGFQNFAAGSFAAGGGSIPAIQSSINSVLGLDDIEQYKPMLLSSDASFAVPASPGAGNSRIDIIEVSALRFVNNPLSRDIMNPATGVFTPNLVNKTLEWALDNHTGSVTTPALSTAPLSYKIGGVFATPTYNPANVPPTTAGYIKLAEIFVGPAAVSINTDVISDFRHTIAPYGSASLACRVQVNTGGVGGQMLDRQCPPGFRMTVSNVFSGGTGGVATLYILLPSSTLQVLPSVQLMNDNSVPGTDIRVISLSDPIIGTVDTSVQSDLAAANPSISAAIGQPYVQFNWLTTRIATPFTLGAILTPNPAIYSFSAKVSSF